MDTTQITPPSHPTLILVRGLPGSGKSYLAEALAAKLGSDHAVVIDPDATDYTSQAYRDMSASLTTEGVDEKFHPYRFIRAQAYAGITSGKVVIWTQAFTNLEMFTKTVVNLQTYASEHGTTLPLLVVEVEADVDIAKARAAQREAETGRGVSAEAFARFINDYSSFAGQEYDPVVVRGDSDVNTSVSTVLEALHHLWQQ
jgi:predicted kinase